MMIDGDHTPPGKRSSAGKRPTREPTFGLEAIMVDERRLEAELMGMNGLSDLKA